MIIFFVMETNSNFIYFSFTCMNVRAKKKKKMYNDLQGNYSSLQKKSKKKAQYRQNVRDILLFLCIMNEYKITYI